MRDFPKKGTALVTTIAILMVLSTMGISFIRCMTQERVAASNFSDAIQAKMVALAGVERAQKEIIERFRTRGYSEEGDVLFYDMSDTRPLEQATYLPYGSPKVGGAPDYNPPQPPLCPLSLYWSGAAPGPYVRNANAGRISDGTNHYYYCGIVGPGRYERNGDVYSIRISNLAGRFNVNSHKSIPGSPEQGLSNEVVRRILTTLCGRCAQKIGIAPPAGEISTLVDRIRPSGNTYTPYRSIDELKEDINACITNTLLEQEISNNLCADSWMDPQTVAVQNPNRLIYVPPTYLIEERAPVDINRASPELIRSLIENIKATAVLYNNSGTGTQQTPAAESGTRITEEIGVLSNIPTKVDIAFSSTNADDIYDEISTYVGGNFNYKCMSQLEDCIDQIDYDAGNHDQNAPVVLPSNPHPAWLSNAIWKQACRGALKSNFNSNTRDNIWNPDKTVHCRVSKADLYNSTNWYHTTDICFSSMGRFAIDSYGRVTMNNHSRIISSSNISAIVEVYNLDPTGSPRLRHTSQQEFSTSNGGVFGTAPNDTLSYPRIYGVDVADTAAGWVEPKVSVYNSSPPNHPATFLNLDVTSPARQIPPTESRKFQYLKVLGGVALRKMQSISIRDSQSYTAGVHNNLVNDGLLSRRASIITPAAPNNNDLQYSQYVSVPALQTTYGYLTHNGGGERWENEAAGYCMGYYRGAIEFWVKLDVDADEGVPCGLLSATVMGYFYPSRDHTTIWSHEGIQLYVFKNTVVPSQGRGQLRFTHIYFIPHYNLGGGDAGSLWHWDTDNLDKDKLNFNVGRRDEVVEIDWKAHTWHHVFIKWCDRDGDFNIDNKMEVWIDSVKQNNSVRRVGDWGSTIYPVPLQLNEMMPAPPSNPPPASPSQSSEGVFINGFFRYLRNGRDGIFKLGENAGTYKLHYPGNATINNVVSYNQNGGSPVNHTRRYQASATYSNSLIIDNIDKAVLGPLKWTSYPRNPNPSAATMPPPVVLSDYLVTACSANLKVSNDGGTTWSLPIANYEERFNPGLGTFGGEGWDGEGVATQNRVDLESTLNNSRQYKVDYTITFYTPEHSHMLTHDPFRGSVCPALDSIEVMVLHSRLISLIIRE